MTKGEATTVAELLIMHFIIIWRATQRCSTTQTEAYSYLCFSRLYAFNGPPPKPENISRGNWPKILRRAPSVRIRNPQFRTKLRNAFWWTCKILWLQNSWDNDWVRYIGMFTCSVCIKLRSETCVRLRCRIFDADCITGLTEKSQL